jgi:hypothetical protein
MGAARVNCSGEFLVTAFCNCFVTELRKCVIKAEIQNKTKDENFAENVKMLNVHKLMDETVHQWRRKEMGQIQRRRKCQERIRLRSKHFQEVIGGWRNMATTWTVINQGA